jgi:hypothetical protein
MKSRSADRGQHQACRGERRQQGTNATQARKYETCRPKTSATPMNMLNHLGSFGSGLAFGRRLCNCSYRAGVKLTNSKPWNRNTTASNAWRTQSRRFISLFLTLLQWLQDIQKSWVCSWKGMIERCQYNTSIVDHLARPFRHHRNRAFQSILNGKGFVHSRHQPLYYIRKRNRQSGQTPVSAHSIKRFVCIAGGTKALSHSQIILKCLTGTQGCYFFLWRA